jgi:diguanylate cyclase (GGDEF)-like protein/PAS domain S-box-containing protein
MLSLCGLIAIVMTTFIFQAVEQQRQFLIRHTKERSLALARTLAATSSNQILAYDSAGLEETVRVMRNQPDLLYVMVMNADGMVLAHSNSYKVGIKAIDSISLSLLTSPPRAHEVANPSAGIHVAAPIRAGKRLIGWVRIGMGRKRSMEVLRSISWQGMLFTMSAITLAALLISIVGRGLVEGLNTLTAMTERVAAGEINARVSMEGDDELGALSASFDSMAEALDKSNFNFRAKEKELRQVLANLPVPILIRMPDGVISYANEAARKTLNISAEEAQSGQLFFPHWRFIHPNGTVMPPEEIPVIRAMRAKQPVSGHMLGVIPQGATEPRWLHLNAYPELDVDNNVSRVVVAFLDLTDLKRAEERLTQLSAAVEQSPVSVFITDTKGSIRYVNPAFCTFTGFQQEEVIGRNPRILSGGETSAEDYAKLWQTIKSGEVWHGTLHNKRKDGTRMWAETNIAPIRSSGGTITQFVCIQQDITARKEAEERVEFLAHHDTLTGLPNRMMGKERMQWAMAQADRSKSKAALMFLDLDGFKRINDTLGHGTGDSLLKEVAERLLKCMRRTDTIARQGGDEFLLMLGGIRERSDAITPATTLLEHIARPYHIDGHKLTVSGSLGIAVYPEDGQDWETLLQVADLAMYSAKESGRNTYRFSNGQGPSSIAEMPLPQANSPNALLRCDYVLHYHPRIDYKNGLVAGFAAQLLWNSPDQGLIPPDTAVLSETLDGQNTTVSTWALREACRQAATWQTAGGRPIAVAISVPVTLLHNKNMLATIIHALADSGLDPAYLELEISSALLSARDTHAVTAIGQIKALGVTLIISMSAPSLSDFENFKKYKPDKIKFESQAVGELLNGSEATPILATLLKNAHDHGIAAIVEGVDDEAAFNAIVQCDCDLGQGLHFTSAIPFEETAAFLQDFQPPHTVDETRQDAVKLA